MEKDLFVISLIETYGVLLTERQRRLLGDYYLLDLSLGEIALNYGTSRQGVFDAVKKGRKQLEDYESKLGFVKKTAQLELLKRSVDVKSAEKIDEILKG